MLIELNTPSKNSFLGASFFGDSRLFLLEMNQKLILGGNIDYRDSYLKFVFSHFEVLRLYAKLQDTAGAVKAQSGEGIDYCYKIGRGPNSCSLGHVTGLVFCLHVKLFLLSILSFIDFCSLMSCIVLNNELADKKVIRELSVFINRNVQGYSFPAP